METRITEKEIELEGRKFILRKFDPMFGSYISLKIFQSSSGGDKNKFDIENTKVLVEGIKINLILKIPSLKLWEKILITMFNYKIKF